MPLWLTMDGRSFPRFLSRTLGSEPNSPNHRLMARCSNGHFLETGHAIKRASCSKVAHLLPQTWTDKRGYSEGVRYDTSTPVYDSPRHSNAPLTNIVSRPLISTARIVTAARKPQQ